MGQTEGFPSPYVAQRCGAGALATLQQESGKRGGRPVEEGGELPSPHLLAGGENWPPGSGLPSSERAGNSQPGLFCKAAILFCTKRYFL